MVNSNLNGEKLLQMKNHLQIQRFLIFESKQIYLILPQAIFLNVYSLMRNKISIRFNLNLKKKRKLSSKSILNENVISVGDILTNIFSFFTSIIQIHFYLFELILEELHNFYKAPMLFLLIFPFESNCFDFILSCFLYVNHQTALLQ